MKHIYIKSLMKAKSNETLSTDELIDEYLASVAKTNKKQTEAFVADLLVYVMQRVESVDKEQLLALVESKLVHLSYTIDSTTIEDIYNKSAVETATEIGVAFSFSQDDTRVIKSVNQSLLWLKDDGTVKTQDKLKEVLASALEGDISTAEIGDKLREAFNDVVDESSNYFTGVSDHVIRQSQSLNRAYQFKNAGVEFVKVKAVIDDRTSVICRSLHNKLIPISHVIDQADSIVEAETIDQKKEASPWQKDAIEGTLPNNVGLPPYHFRCRTIVVAHFEDS